MIGILLGPVLSLAIKAFGWLLPFVGPLRAALSGLSGRIGFGASIGGLVMVACLVLVAGTLGLKAWRLIDPPPAPPPTYTHAEIEAARLKAENAAIRAALDENMTLRHIREQRIAALEAELDDQKTLMEQTRETIADPDGVVLPADSQWLREWQRRGR